VRVRRVRQCAVWWRVRGGACVAARVRARSARGGNAVRVARCERHMYKACGMPALPRYSAYVWQVVAG